MGVSRTPAELAGKLQSAASALNDTKPALNAGGLAGKAIFAAAAGSVVGKKPQGKRRPVGVRYDLLRDYVLWLGYTGPAHLFNNPTKRHQIFRSVATARGRGARKANTAAKAAVAAGARGAFSGGSLALPDGGFRKVVTHPGTKGKRFFGDAKGIALKRLPPTIDQAYLKEPLRRIFG